MTERITLLLGGARSGKSNFAEKLAWSRGGDQVTYLATSEVRDNEMKERVRMHRSSRPVSWQTLEEPVRISQALAELSSGTVVLIDCITVFISNLLLKGERADNEDIDFDPPGREDEIMQEIQQVIAKTREKGLDLIIVSNEVGQGLIPMYRLGRIFRDITGRVNQFLAREADEVYLCYAGLPVEIKEIGLENLRRVEDEQKK